MLAFHRANPKFGEMAADGSTNTDVAEPLPECFYNLLTKNILVKAKRDEIQKLRTQLEKDRVVLSKIRKQRDGLKEIFAELSKSDEYSKSGTAGWTSMSALLTMQTSEFTTFALDCGLMTDDFGTARINNIFTRADQVDDKLKAKKVKTVDKNASAKGNAIDKNDQSSASHRIAEVETTVMVGEGAKGGDKGLTFPEFLEALCACALFRANPKLGELGHTDECAFPLPDCLDSLLTKNILVNAKRDKLALVKSSMETDAEVRRAD